eukprot:505547-Rhodomonas_salina.5
MFISAQNGFTAVVDRLIAAKGNVNQLEKMLGTHAHGEVDACGEVFGVWHLGLYRVVRAVCVERCVGVRGEVECGRGESGVCVDPGA